MKRRDFLMRIGGALVVVPAVIHVTACGGDDDGGVDGGPSGATFPVTNDSGDGSGHTHSFNLRCSDVNAGTSASYTATGSGHTHEVTLTGDDMVSLGMGNTVTKMTTSSHNHTWIIRVPAGTC